MKLPKELTIVTPFSKRLALILFIILPIIGFFFGMQYQQIQDLSDEQKDLIQSVAKTHDVANENITLTPIPSTTKPVRK